MGANDDDDFLRKLIEVVELISEKSKPFLVAVAGGSCVGKSYFAEKLAGALFITGIESTTVPLDNYFKDRDDASHPRDEIGKLILDVPDSYDSGRFTEQVMKLLKGEWVKLPAYDKKTCRLKISEGVILLPKPVIIAEGLYAIRFLSGIWPDMISVYLRAGRNVSLQRRIMRDVAAYNVTEEKVRKFFLDSVEKYFKSWNIQQMKQADLVIDT